jgi:hypothetical protein
MKKTYATINLIIVIAMIAVNYYSSIVGINGNTMGKLSAKYYNLFTPAGYAFSIWGLIFIGQLFHAYYQIKKAFWDTKHNDFLSDIGPWLIITNLANIAWIFVWLNEWTGASVLVMLTILFALTKLIINLNMERWDAPFKVIRWIWWPIVGYAGWIAVATIANIAAYLAKIEWQWLFSEETWAIIMIIVATALNLFMLITRSMREFVVIGVWAIFAIAVRHWGEIASLQWTAVASVIVLIIAMNIHAYINWDTNPLNKMLQKRKST